MAYVLRLVARTDAYNSEPVTVDFISATTPEGVPEFAKIQQEEELTSPGIDGRRFRTIFEQFRPFDCECMSDHTSFDSAIDQHYKVLRLKGRIVDAYWVMAGTTYPVRTIHIAETGARILPGKTAGANTTASAAAIVIATIRMVKMSDEDGSGLVQA